MDAFDSDALISAAAPDHALGRRVRQLFLNAPPGQTVGIGSTLLVPAVAGGADRFITNNKRDFPSSIVEVDIVYPDNLGP